MLEQNLKDIDFLKCIEEDEKHKFRIIAGHNAGLLRGTFTDAKFITLIREPVARAISGYLHAKYHPDAKEIIGKYIERNNITLAQFIKEDLFAKCYADFVSLQNGQSKILLGKDYNMFDIKNRQVLCDSVRSRYHLVGYTESLALFLFFLHITEGVQLAWFNYRLIRKERNTYKPSHEDLETVKQFNQVDLALYSILKLDFDRRVALQWNPKLKVLYQNYCRALEKFRKDTRNDFHIAEAYFDEFSAC